MQLISLRESPGQLERFIAFFQRHWANENSMMVYRDNMEHAVSAEAPLPQWYMLTDKDIDVGGCGLITNDFISRGELYPWICALYIEEAYRGHEYGSVLLERASSDAKQMGFHRVYLCSDHVGFYERYGFTRIGVGYHPWGETSGVFEKEL